MKIRGGYRNITLNDIYLAGPRFAPGGGMIFHGEYPKGTRQSQLPLPPLYQREILLFVTPARREPGSSLIRTVAFLMISILGEVCDVG